MFEFFLGFSLAGVIGWGIIRYILADNAYLSALVDHYERTIPWVTPAKSTSPSPSTNSTESSSSSNK